MFSAAQISDHAVLDRPANHAGMAIDPDSFAPQNFATGPKIFDRRHIPLFERDGEIHGEKYWVTATTKFIKFLFGGAGVG